MPTIRDVAKLAGVAPITVSRVVNNSGYIRPETRERVLAAVSQLGYVPNTLARSLRSRQTGMLALVITDITNPFFTTLARGVEDAASQAGFNVLLCNTDESEEKQDKYLHALLQKRVDGVVLVPARSHNEPVRFIHQQGVPVVVADRSIPHAEADVVRCDSEDGAYQLVRLLLALGHRQIALLNGPQDASTAADRAAGYRRALTEAGINPDSQAVYSGGFTQASGYALANHALAASPRPTALFAANNFIAIGALKALQAANVRVPEEISLVGFDDLPEALVTFPFLTVASQPAYEMGQIATQVLIERISEEKPAHAYREIVLPTVVVERKSTARMQG
jgi:LacI family transcriptional regulator